MPPPVPQPLQKATSLAPDAALPPGAILAFTFAAPGVTVNVWATEEATGVRFDFRTALDPGWNIDLNGFFLDLDGDGGSIRSYGTSSNNMNGGGRDGYDHAVVLGAVGGNMSLDFRNGFWLLEGITLDDLEGADAGLRATSYGFGNREDSLKLGDEFTPPPQASIEIEKLTNGTDGYVVYWVDENDNNLLVPIEWSYQVTNTGDVALTNIQVWDDNGTPFVGDPSADPDGFLVGTIALLNPGQSETLYYTKAGDASLPENISPDFSDYENVATATGVSVVGIVSDTDPSWLTFDIPVQ